jgi:flagellar hook-associated protein FlgK
MNEILIYKELRKIRKGVKKVMSAVTDFTAKVQKQFDDTNTSLDNIVADEANLAKQITDLAAQIAASPSTLVPADQTALDTLVTNATAVAAKTAGIAAAVPDLPAPPPAPA